MVVIDGMQATGGDGGMIPEGESSQVFAENVAGFIQNMVPHPDGGLESVRGPCPLIHDLGAGYPLIGTPHGLFSARLRERTTLLMHAGSTMWTFEGSDPAAPWQATVDPAGAAVQALADDDRPRTPDQFVQFSDYVIWTNGVDRARIISSGDITFPLGFSETPSAPEVDGPVSPGETDKARYFVNSKGFSWKGEIGTEGDVLSSGSGKLLTSAHRYCVQLEDHFGNLSPISPASNSFNVWSIRSQPYSLDNNDVVTARLTTAEIDDLLRMASVFISGGRPRHAKAARVGRTADIRRNPRDFKLLRRIPGRGNTVFPDYISDGRLGAPMVEKAPVPIFRYMVRHGARLIIANMVSDPGMVRRSDIGYPGTFSEREWSTPAPDASEVSGLISHGGLLIAGTTTSLVDMSGDKFHRPETLTKMVGIGAHRSVQGLSDGSVVWLGVNGHFYRMDTNGGLQLADISDGIRTLVTQGLNLSRLQQAASVVHPRVKFSRTYAPTATALVTSGTDRLHVYGRQAFIMEIPSWPSVAATASVEIPAMQSEDTVDQIALSTNRMAVLTTAYNNIPTGAIARGGLQHRQLPRAVYDWAQVSIEPGSGGVATDDFYPGYANTIGTVLEGVANRTNQSGWYLLEDAMGATFDTVANHPAAFNATDPGLFLVLANIQCASIERDGAHDVPSLFGQYAIAAEGDLDGTAVVQWHVNAASQALVNNFNTFGLPARADDVDPEEMDVAIMAIYDFRTVQLTSDIVRFGVVAASATEVGGPGSRCRNRWRHGSMQVFRFRPGVL